MDGITICQEQTRKRCQASRPHETLEAAPKRISHHDFYIVLFRADDSTSSFHP